MKRKKPYLLAGLVLLLFLLCTACGNTEGQIAPQDDPNEGLGGGLSEDTVNDFSGFEGIWLGEADNDYDSMEFDAEGNWTLYLSGEVVDDGYLRYEPEWEAIYAYSSSDDSGSLITMEEGQLYSAAYGYFNPGEGMEYLWYEDGGRLTEDDEPDPSGDEVSDWNGRLDGDPDAYWSWDSDLCQRNVSEFNGIWYYDGVNYFAVPAGYTLDEDGQARDEDGKLFTGDWSGERYDPAAVWGPNWGNENWGGNS